ncbi:MAG: hypothetical protein ABIQ09_08445 [Jatrophihabitantaceae bacterium]
MLADSANELVHLTDVEVRLGLDGVALLPIAGLLRTCPRHRLTDDVFAPQVHEKQRTESVAEDVGVISER